MVGPTEDRVPSGSGTTPRSREPIRARELDAALFALDSELSEGDAPYAIEGLFGPANEPGALEAIRWLKTHISDGDIPTFLSTFAIAVYVMEHRDDR
jgi:hypothetical protein